MGYVIRWFAQDHIALGKRDGRLRIATDRLSIWKYHLVALLAAACLRAYGDGFQIPIAKSSRAYALLKDSHLVYFEPDSNRLTSAEFPSGRIRWRIPWSGLADNAMLYGNAYLSVRRLEEDRWEFQSRSVLAAAHTRTVKFKDASVLHVRIIDSLRALVFEKSAIGLLRLDSSASKIRAPMTEGAFPSSNAFEAGGYIYCLASFDRTGVKLLRLQASKDTLKLTVMPAGPGITHYVDRPLLTDRFILQNGALYRARKTSGGLALSLCPLAKTCRFREIGSMREKGRIIGFAESRPAFLSEDTHGISFVSPD